MALTKELIDKMCKQTIERWQAIGKCKTKDEAEEYYEYHDDSWGFCDNLDCLHCLSAMFWTDRKRCGDLFGDLFFGTVILLSFPDREALSKKVIKRVKYIQANPQEFIDNYDNL